jgi:hypothetical protein
LQQGNNYKYFFKGEILNRISPFVLYKKMPQLYRGINKKRCLVNGFYINQKYNKNKKGARIEIRPRFKIQYPMKNRCKSTDVLTV